jgi:hypothetical protein
VQSSRKRRKTLPGLPISHPASAAITASIRIELPYALVAHKREVYEPYPTEFTIL